MVSKQACMSWQLFFLCKVHARGPVNAALLLLLPLILHYSCLLSEYESGENNSAKESSVCTAGILFNARISSSVPVSVDTLDVWRLLDLRQILPRAKP